MTVAKSGGGLSDCKPRTRGPDRTMSKSSRKPLLISFSGMDGAGKSTQIEYLRRYLEERGRRVKMLVFWDNVVVGTRYREGFVHKVYGSEQGIGSPERPVERRDKNVRKWYLNLARHGLYALDAMHLVQVVRAARRSDADVIVMDRYIYDELANLPLANPTSRGFISMIAELVPRPDVAYILDADPEAARARKPEYPVDFLRVCRSAYLGLARQLQLTVIPPLPLEEAQGEVERAIAPLLQDLAPIAETPLNSASAA